MRLVLCSLLFCLLGVAHAEIVTVRFEGSVDRVDAPLAAGPFALGQPISGSYTYENDPALNPDSNGGPVGQYALDGVSPITIGSAYPATPSGLVIFNDGDGWDADIDVMAPPIGAFQPIGFTVNLRDLDDTVFTDDSLPFGPPGLAEFEIRRLRLFYFDGVTLAEVSGEATFHRADPVPTTLLFSGPILDKTDDGSATYSSVPVGDSLFGALTLGASSLGATFDPVEANWLFDGPEFFGTLRADGITSSTEGSVRPLEVRFLDDVPSDAGTIALINALLGTSLPVGTPFDLAEIETDITTGNRRIEFGVSLISLDLSLITSSDYRPFPTLGEVDVALYLVLEEVDDVVIFDALGQVTSLSTRIAPGTVAGLRANTITAGSIDLSYTPACGATDHTVVWGPLDQVGSYAYVDQLCAIGTGGSVAFDPGVDSAFFLIVANDGATEGSYGLTGTGAERPEDMNDPVCLLEQYLLERCD